VFFATVVAALFFFGLIMSFSAGFAQRPNSDIIKQFIIDGLAVAICCAIVFIFYKTRIFERQSGIWSIIAWVLWIIALILMVLVISPMGTGAENNGAQRWLDIKVMTVQPSEFAKIAVLLMTAVQTLRWRAQKPYAVPILVFTNLIILLLTFLQKDMGSMGIMCFGIVAILFLGNARFTLQKGARAGGFLIIAIIALVAVALVYTYYLDPSRAYRWDSFNATTDQIIAWDSSPTGSGTTDTSTTGSGTTGSGTTGSASSTSTDTSSSDAGYSLLQPKNGFYALGDGGLTGLGLGLSKQKYALLANAYDDYVFAVIGEELGFVGAGAVVLGFLLLALSGLSVARAAGSLRGRMLAGGATMLIAVQAMINFCTVTGAGPLTGKPLPFFSAGGSSMISTFLLVSIVMAVALCDRRLSPAVARRDKMRILEGGGGRTAVAVAGASGNPFSPTGSLSPLPARASQASSRQAPQYGQGRGVKPPARASQAPQRPTGQTGQPSRPARATRTDRPERADRAERTDRATRATRTDRPASQAQRPARSAAQAVRRAPSPARPSAPAGRPKAPADARPASAAARPAAQPSSPTGQRAQRPQRPARPSDQAMPRAPKARILVFHPEGQSELGKRGRR